jgi:hypothetical protein
VLPSNFLEIRPSRAGPGRAKPSPAGQGRRLEPAPGQLLDLASFKKTLDLSRRNKHFWGGPPKPIISPTPNDHIQNSILTPAVYDPSPAGPTAPSEIARQNCHAPLCGEMRCFFRPKKCNQPNPLTKPAGPACANEPNRFPADLELTRAASQPFRTRSCRTG